MNTAILKSAGIDYDLGVKRFMGKAAIYEKVLGRFLSDTTFQRAREAFDASDTEQLIKDAHELKGVSGNMAMTGLFQAADALVQLMRGDAYSAGELQTAFALLENEYRDAKEAVSAALGA